MNFNQDGNNNYLYKKWGKNNVEKTKKLVDFLLENKDKNFKRENINLLVYEGKESPVKIREYVNMARNWGYGIIASKYGYCLTTNEVLLNKYIESRENELRIEGYTLNNMKMGSITIMKEENK